jgi:hypothetical protein
MPPVPIIKIEAFKNYNCIHQMSQHPDIFTVCAACLWAGAVEFSVPLFLQAFCKKETHGE